MQRGVVDICAVLLANRQIIKDLATIVKIEHPVPSELIPRYESGSAVERYDWALREIRLSMPGLELSVL